MTKNSLTFPSIPNNRREKTMIDIENLTVESKVKASTKSCVYRPATVQKIKVLPNSKTRVLVEINYGGGATITDWRNLDQLF